MRKRLILAAVSLFSGAYVFGQACDFYFPQESGTTLTYQYFDKKDKPTGKMSQELVSYSSTASGTKAEVVSKSYDENDEVTNETNLVMRCENGSFYIDMMSYVNPESMAAYEGMEVKIDARDVELPANLSVGQKLKDADIKISVNTGIIPINFSVSITDRVVEAKENVTTPAGTFDTYKINQTNTLSFGFQMVLPTTEWYSKDVGMVKSVSYKSDKPYTRTELISITH
ncbi:MAG: hypothetical protein JW801_09005 [Bacteroidales bacterium]|nr:hypothetical protein [Bacteroidales bacterium]